MLPSLALFLNRECALESDMYQVFRRATTLGISLLAASAAFAGQIYNDWNYAIDADDDHSGGAVFADYGLAFRVHDGFAIFAFSTAMPLNGTPWSGTLNDNISPGDLFINMSGQNLDTPAAFNNSDVLAVRFAPNGDDTVGLGVYTDVTAVSRSTSNSGWATLQAYINGGFGRTVGAMGDLSSSTADVVPYLGNGAMMTGIESGQRVGDVTMLDATTLSGLGLDFDHFGIGGHETYGVAIDASLISGRAFTAHRFAECLNDGVAIQAVPEPTSMAAVGLGLAALIRRRRK